VKFNESSGSTRENAEDTVIGPLSGTIGEPGNSTPPRSAWSSAVTPGRSGPPSATTGKTRITVGLPLTSGMSFASLCRTWLISKWAARMSRAPPTVRVFVSVRFLNRGKIRRTSMRPGWSVTLTVCGPFVAVAGTSNPTWLEVSGLRDMVVPSNWSFTPGSRKEGPITPLTSTVMCCPVPVGFGCMSSIVVQANSARHRMQISPDFRRGIVMAHSLSQAGLSRRLPGSRRIRRHCPEFATIPRVARSEAGSMRVRRCDQPEPGDPCERIPPPRAVPRTGWNPDSVRITE
jgi:hypothetical protein